MQFDQPDALRGHWLNVAAQVEREILDKYDEPANAPSTIWFHCSNRQTRKLLYTIFQHYGLQFKTVVLKARVDADVGGQHYCPSDDCDLPNNECITRFVTHIYKLRKAVLVTFPFPRRRAKPFLKQLDRLPVYHLIKIEYSEQPLNKVYLATHCEVTAHFDHFTKHFDLPQYQCKTLH